MFIDPRDRYGITQVVFHPGSLPAEAMAEAGRLRSSS